MPKQYKWNDNVVDGQDEGENEGNDPAGPKYGGSYKRSSVALAPVVNVKLLPVACVERHLSPAGLRKCFLIQQ